MMHPQDLEGYEGTMGLHEEDRPGTWNEHLNTIGNGVASDEGQTIDQLIHPGLFLFCLNAFPFLTGGATGDTIPHRT